MLSDKDIVEGIASNNNKVLGYIYAEIFPFADSYILQHGGTTDLAKDIFQEAMIIVFKKIMAGKFTLHCKFSTYLLAVCKRLWIQDRKKHYLRANKMKEHTHTAEPGVSYGDETIGEARQLMEKHFQKISPDCQKILLMHFNGLEMEEIRREMGISTVHHATDKKYRCKKSLIERIKKDPQFRKLKNE